MGEWIPILAVFLIFGGGGLVVKIVEDMNKTRLEMARLRAQNQSLAAGGSDVTALREEVALLRKEMHDLRDTTTQYDLSFDTALQRLESRVNQIEQQRQQIRN